MVKDLRLPESTAQTPPKAAPILVVTNEWIILDGTPVEKVETVLTQRDNIINSLKTQLQQIRAFSESLAQLNANMRFKGNIAIQGDKEIPFGLLKKIMFTCGQVGFNDMLLVVNQAEQS